MTREEKQKAIDALKISAPLVVVTQEEFNAYIQTLNKVMDWLEQEPCEDAVSREAVIDALDKHCDIVCEYSKKQRSVMCGACPMGTAFDVIEGLPSVQPERPKGEWRHYEGFLTCQNCNAEFYDDIMEYCGDEVPKFCPNCGADMRGGE